jgi:hypothetical protein
MTTITQAIVNVLFHGNNNNDEDNGGITIIKIKRYMLQYKHVTSNSQFHHHLHLLDTFLVKLFFKRMDVYRYLVFSIVQYSSGEIHVSLGD